MAKYCFTITETSTFFVDLDTDNEEQAYETIREMVMSGDIALDRPDDGEIIEEVKKFEVKED